MAKEEDQSEGDEDKIGEEGGGKKKEEELKRPDIGRRERLKRSMRR